MASVLALQRDRSGVHRELRSDTCRQMRNQIEIVFIPGGVRLNPTDDVLFKHWWLEPVLQEQFVCAIHVLEPAPNIIAFGKAKRGFRQISIPNQARFEAFVSSPQQSTGPVFPCLSGRLYMTEAVILQVLGRMKGFWAGEMGNRVLRTQLGAGLKVARMYQESIFPESMSQRNSSGSHP